VVADSVDTRNDDLALAGWISAVAMPSAGLLLGHVLHKHGDRRGRRITALSLVVISIAVLAITAVIAF
jgi:hypothetical protein